jgi:GTP cyclohydrolase I
MKRSDLADLQASQGAHPLRLDAVGISQLRHPIVVLDRAQSKQETVATISMSVDLDAASRGAHLSRFLEVLDDSSGELTMRTAGRLLEDLRSRLGSATATVEAEFPYFIEKRAPVTGARGLLDVTCRFSFSGSHKTTDLVLAVTVPVTTLCPCSKAVSDYGAHNQRCDVSITVRLDVTDPPTEDDIVWIEELVDLAERHSSAPIYPTLKREDERFVTMQAFDNPAFVEDVVRGIAASLSDDPRIQDFCVEASSDESIHNHRAFARIGSPLR